MTTITLSKIQLWHAASVGIARRCSAIWRSRAEPHGTPTGSAADLWGADIDAAAAEMVVAMRLGLWWHSLGTPHEITADCGLDVQVRHTRHTDGRLIVYDRESDTQRFVLVTGTSPEFRICGWIVGAEAKRAEHWNADARTPAYFVPQRCLRPIEEWDRG